MENIISSDELFWMIDECQSQFNDMFGELKFNGRAIAKLIDWIIQYGEEEVGIATQISLMTYGDKNVAFEKIGGILYNRKNYQYKFTTENNYFE